MKAKITKLVTSVSLSLLCTLVTSPAMAQNTAKGEVKKSGSEAKKAGTSLGNNMKHGRVKSGGKQFGKHMGKAGKHFGRSTKKAFKKVF